MYDHGTLMYIYVLYCLSYLKFLYNIVECDVFVYVESSATFCQIINFLL